MTSWRCCARRCSPRTPLCGCDRSGSGPADEPGRWAAHERADRFTAGVVVVGADGRAHGVYRSLYGALSPLRDAASNAVNYGIAILFVATFGTVGALIASRRPENPIGWVFCGMGLALVVAVFTGNYAQYALVVEPGALPRAETAAWVGNWIWLVALSPLGFFLLLFPDGRPPSPRWRWVGWLQAVALAGWTASQALVPGPLLNAGYESLDNPYGIEALGGVLRWVGAGCGSLLVMTLLASVVSVVVRFWRSRGDERRQIKWVAYAGGVVALVIGLQFGAETALPESDLVVEVLNLSLVVSLTTVPIAAGVRSSATASTTSTRSSTAPSST